jgi:wyosine [tRNA(Phe)-imidazoG37] synthetase (radical SAM superfamily)
MDGAHDFHDFRAKLLQESAWGQVVDYLHWQQDLAAAERMGDESPAPPDAVPLSINLDLTTACNYQCDHCIDWDILNSGKKHNEEHLRDSLRELANRGMKSVILIGGGEPTLYPRFVEIVRYLKQLEQQVAIVSNGSRGDRLLAASKYLEQPDWIRLSLDAATDATFQAMHKPRQGITLDGICEWVPKIKERNNAVQVGYSFIVTWRGAARDEVPIIENIEELVAAAERARKYRFDYLSVKPFLVRHQDSGSEIMDPEAAKEDLDRVIERIKIGIENAKKLETDTFKIVQSTNLRLLEQQTWQEYTRQPRRCHMQALRQVLTPDGIFNCPGYRGVPAAKIAGPAGYVDQAAIGKTQIQLADTIKRFDASVHCANVTCLYNATNWWLQELIDEPEKVEQIEAEPDNQDFFL